MSMVVIDDSRVYEGGKEKGEARRRGRTPLPKLILDNFKIILPKSESMPFMKLYIKMQA